MDGVTQGKESLENFQDVKLLIGFLVCLFFVDFFMKTLELCNFFCGSKVNCFRFPRASLAAATEAPAAEDAATSLLLST